MVKSLSVAVPSSGARLTRQSTRTFATRRPVISALCRLRSAYNRVCNVSGCRGSTPDPQAPRGSRENRAHATCAPSEMPGSLLLIAPPPSIHRTATRARWRSAGRLCLGRSSCCTPSCVGQSAPARPGRRASTLSVQLAGMALRASEPAAQLSHRADPQRPGYSFPSSASCAGRWGPLMLALSFTCDLGA